MFKNLKELLNQMPDEKSCRDYLAKQGWDGRTVCPYEKRRLWQLPPDQL